MSVLAVQRWQAVTVTALLILIEFGVSTSGQVLLTSNLEEDGQSAACPGDEVVFKCTAYSTTALAWRVQDLGSIVFLSCDEVATKRRSGEFQGKLTGNSNICKTANMNSTLTVVVMAEHNGYRVECTEASGMAAELTLLVANARPSPPQHFRYSTEPNACKTSTVLLMWEPPLSFGGASQIDSYTVTLTYTSDDGVDHSVRDTVEEEQIFPISDALLYIANVTALNCIGESTAAMQTIHTGCEQPSRPSRGYLVQGDEACTAEGSHINFACSLNLFPDEVSESVCRGGEWQPNPRDVVCWSDCGHPATHKHVTVYYGSSSSHNHTRESSEIAYKCSTGYVPQDEWQSVCTANGTWSPDPSGLECKAKCSKPEPPINGSILSINESTLEGSEIIYRCNMGLVPSGNLTAVCTDDRRWHPDPAQEHCREQAMCGSVSPPKNGVIVASNSTLEGSLVVLACTDGFIPEGEMVTECTADGQWRPDPGDIVCQVDSNGSGGNTKTLIVLCATVPTAIILVTASLVFIGIITFIKKRCTYDSGRQQRTSIRIPSALSSPAPPVTREEPVYEDIVSYCTSSPLNLKQNTAYGESVEMMTSEGGVQQCV